MITLGNKDIKDIQRGVTPVNSVYRGNTLVWSRKASYEGLTIVANAPSTFGLVSVPKEEVMAEIRAMEAKRNGGIMLMSGSVGVMQLGTYQTLEYSLDGNTWLPLDTTTTVNLNDGQEMYVRGKLTGNNTSSDYTQFFITGDVSLKGNINYIWNYENPNAPLYNYCGYGLFRASPGITDVSQLVLPSTTLSNYCYSSMFNYCENLVKAPKVLPATTLATNCYYQMFYNCNSLTEAPKLPAMSLANYCYYQMFYGCTSLTTAPELPATTLGSECYDSMFYNCKSLVNAPKTLPATTLVNWCYDSMFEGCTSLEEAPQILATTLALYCCNEMFKDCTKLKSVTETLPATAMRNSCYSSMFKNCTSLTKAPKILAEDSDSSCFYSMFEGCSSLKEVPEMTLYVGSTWACFNMFKNCTSLTEVPITFNIRQTASSGCNEAFYGCTSLEKSPTIIGTFAETCMQQMFLNCSKLNYIKCLCSGYKPATATNNWVYGVSPTGTFVKKTGVDWEIGDNGIPNGWEIIEVDD